MVYIIDPKRFDIEEESRLIGTTKIGNNIDLKQIVPAGKKAVIKEKKVINNINQYKFKIQVRRDTKWVDKVKYYILINKTDLSNYLTDKKSLNDDDIKNLINYYNNSSPKIKIELRQMYKKVCEYLWLDHNADPSNLKYFLNYVELNTIKINLLWENLILYLKYIVRLKDEFKALKINRYYYDDLKNKNYLEKGTKLEVFLSNEINSLKDNDLQFSYLIQALYYSLLGDRETAQDLFVKVDKFETEYENDFLVGQGSQTYIVPEIGRNEYAQNIMHLSDEYNNNGETTILLSVDTRYLRNYSPQILYSILALKNYHFHFHVIGDTVESTQAIIETKMLFNQLKQYMSKTSEIVSPTFSYEEVPAFAYGYRTLSACARFINASYFMERFNSNLLILDADMFITGDLNNYISSMSKFDVGIAMSRGVTTIMPWRRLMAGNVFLLNNEKSKKFIDLAKDYIIDNLDKVKSWTLDQNALSYAFDEVIKIYPSIKIENAYRYSKPLSHPQIRTMIERS